MEQESDGQSTPGTHVTHNPSNRHFLHEDSIE